jgi:hypothetical protein
MRPPGYPVWTGNEPCRNTDPDIFFPDHEPARERVAIIKSICARCASKHPCSAWAIEHEKQGWWGGLSPLERDAIRRSRNIIVSDPSEGMTLRRGG